MVYTATRKTAEQLADYLSRQGWQAAAFHAGLNPPEKRRIQEDFVGGNVRVICATNAFGMGIDKDDVRMVVHADMPGSLENYLQEAGRAGRDRQPAECVLLYGDDDVETQFSLTSLSRLTRHDIAQILRGLRRARKKDDVLVITSGELLRDEDVDTSFDSGDSQADTKVKTAVAWLERAGFLQRNHNATFVFQGKPRVQNLQEAERKLDRLGLPAEKRELWLAVLQELMNVEGPTGLERRPPGGTARALSRLVAGESGRRQEDFRHRTRPADLGRDAPGRPGRTRHADVGVRAVQSRGRLPGTAAASGPAGIVAAAAAAGVGTGGGSGRLGPRFLAPLEPGIGEPGRSVHQSGEDPQPADQSQPGRPRLRRQSGQPGIPAQFGGRVSDQAAARLGVAGRDLRETPGRGGGRAAARSWTRSPPMRRRPATGWLSSPWRTWRVPSKRI